MTSRIATLALAALLATAGAQAAQIGVWRCGADGRNYTDRPCPGGVEVAVADARDPAQVQAARESALREQRLAERLVKEREQRERLAEARFATPHAQPATTVVKLVKAEPEAQPARRRIKRRPTAEEGTWRAIAPATRRKRG